MAEFKQGDKVAFESTFYLTDQFNKGTGTVISVGCPNPECKCEGGKLLVEVQVDGDEFDQPLSYESKELTKID